MDKKKESVESIKKKYKDEWLLITDYETDKSMVPRNGKLVFHSKSREEVHKKLSQYSGKKCIQYSGKLSKDIGVMF
mgnify:CR=1 FL=1